MSAAPSPLTVPDTMLPDIPLPDFGDPPAPGDDWLSAAGLADLPVPSFPDLPAFAEPPLAAAVAAPEPVLTATPPPRRALSKPLLATPPAAQAAGTRQFPTRVVRSADPTVILWQLTVAPDEPWDDVRVRFTIPDGVAAARITDKPTVARRQVSWSFGAVESGCPITLQIRFPAAGVAPVLANSPPPFEVSYTPRPVARLVARATAPARVRHGQPVELRVEVSNVGTAAAQSAELVALAGGAPVARIALPSVAAGASVEVVVPVPSPASVGVARWDVRVTATGADAARASTESSVYAPLLLEVVVPSRLELDAEQTVAVRVENPCGVAQPGGRVTLRLPIELQVGASDGRVNRATAEVFWDVPVWEPQQVREFAATVTGCLPGRFVVDAEIAGEEETRTATAAGECLLIRGKDSTALADWLREQAVPDADEQLSADSPARTQAGERHVVFRLGGQSYASPIRQLREVVRLPAVTPVPGTPDWLLGVANVRGDVLSVVDFPSPWACRPSRLHAARCSSPPPPPSA